MLQEGFDFNKIPTEKSSAIRASNAIKDTVYNYYNKLYLDKFNQIHLSNNLSYFYCTKLELINGIWYIMNIFDNTPSCEDFSHLFITEDMYNFLKDNNIRIYHKLYNDYNKKYVSILKISIVYVNNIDNNFLADIFDANKYDFFLCIQLHAITLASGAVKVLENIINNITEDETYNPIFNIILDNVTFSRGEKNVLHINLQVPFINLLTCVGLHELTIDISPNVSRPIIELSALPSLEKLIINDPNIRIKKLTVTKVNDDINIVLPDKLNTYAELIGDKVVNYNY